MQLTKDSFSLRSECFDLKTRILKMPGLTYRDVKVEYLSDKKLKLKFFPDDDETTTFKRR